MSKDSREAAESGAAAALRMARLNVTKSKLPRSGGERRSRGFANGAAERH